MIIIDNKAARKLVENPEFYKRIKYIDIIYHYIREIISSKKSKSSSYIEDIRDSRFLNKESSLRSIF